MVDSPPSYRVKLEKSEISLLGDDIFYVLYQKDVYLELADFKEARAIFEEWSTEKSLKLLVEFPDFTSVSSEARIFAEKHPIKAIKEAIVYKSLAQRLLVKFYLMVNKQEHPVKAFRKKERALLWLNGNN